MTRARFAPEASGLMFSAHLRRLLLGTATVTGVVIVAASAAAPDGPDAYLTILVLAAAPFATAGLVLTVLCTKRCPESYRGFWRRWLAAALTAYTAGAVALLGVVTHTSAPLAVAAVLLVSAVPLWAAASLHLLRLRNGERAASVDVLGSLTTFVVLGAPIVLILGESVVRADHPGFVVPFVASLALVPAGVYLSILGLSIIPRGERATQAIGTALGGAFAINVSVQIAQILSDFTLPMVAIVSVQVVNMGLLMTVPLWAHAVPPTVLGDRRPEQQVRRVDPLLISTVVGLAGFAALGWITRDQRPWGIFFVLVVLIVAIALGSARQAVLTGETRRLYADIERVAEERRQLLGRMVHALEDDRGRLAAELHVQAVQSFAAMGTLVQTAYATLPPDTARTVKEAIAHLQDDLSSRADALRRLTAAVRPPDLQRDGVLKTALDAFAADVTGAHPAVDLVIEVDPNLDLDWITGTLVYRIVQEALLDAAERSGTRRIEVDICERQEAVVLQVTSDTGRGQRTSDRTDTMQLFADLGNGTLDIAPTSERGTAVRASIRSRVAGVGVSGSGRSWVEPDETRPPSTVAHRPPRHLLLVAGTDPEPAVQPGDPSRMP